MIYGQTRNIFITLEILLVFRILSEILVLDQTIGAPIWPTWWRLIQYDYTSQCPEHDILWLKFLWLVYRVLMFLKISLNRHTSMMTYNDKSMQHISKGDEIQPLLEESNLKTRLWNKFIICRNDFKILINPVKTVFGNKKVLKPRLFNFSHSL